MEPGIGDFQQGLLRRAGAGASLDPDERAALAEWLLTDPTQTGFFGVTAANSGRVVAERLRALPGAVASLSAPLCVAGYEERVECPAEELLRFQLPLAQLLLARAADGAGRMVVAIAGLPAGGKSVFAAVMARVAEALKVSEGIAALRQAQGGHERRRMAAISSDTLRAPFGIVVVGLDGYHYPNAHLLSHPAPPGLPEQGPLKLYKGAHFTFDAARLAADLRRLRAASGPVSLPAYDRTIHDPVEGRIVVAPGDQLVLVEGNYLLYRRNGWENLDGLFDLGIYLDLPPRVNREPMIARHMRGGRGRQDAERHFERADRLNTELVAATRAEADIVVELSERYAVTAILRGARRR